MRTHQTPRRAGFGTLTGSRLGVFLILVIAVLALKASTYDQPPVWDGSFSVFPAAVTLADTGYDMAELLGRPGYDEGGPNVHALSLVTVVTALAIGGLGEGGALLPALHALHYLIAALAGLGLYRIGARVLSPRLALLTAVAGLVAPVVITTAGDIYLELPILAVTVWAAVAFLDDRRGAATAWAVLAVLIKQSGLIVGATLALATLLDPRPDRRHLRDAVPAIGLPGVVAATLVALGPTSPAGSGFLAQMIQTLGASSRFLLNTPDAVVVLLAFLLIRPAVADRPFVGERVAGGHGAEDVARIESLIRALLVSFGGFYVLGGGLGFTTLPRYWSHVLPFVTIGLVTALRRLLAEPAVAAVVAVLAVLFAVNVNGLLYPPLGQNNFAAAERSGEYRGLLAVERDTMAAIEALPPDIPVFYTQAHHYWATYPASGYVADAVVNGTNILLDARGDDPRLEAFPDDFYVAYESSALGGRALMELVAQAEADPGYATEVVEARSGEFWSRLVRITRR